MSKKTWESAVRKKGADTKPLQSPIDRAYLPHGENDTDEYDDPADWLRAMSSGEFWAMWQEYLNESEAQRGWMQIEIIKKFPEFVQWIKKRRDVDYESKVEGSEAVA